MALSLGQILIELALNSASFTQGLSTITVQSQKTAKEIQSAFSEIGGTFSELLGQFGPLGNMIGSVFTEAAGAASKAASAFGGLGGSVGLLGASLGAVAGLGIAAGAAGLEMAKSSAEGAAKLYELSQATGVNVETLSRYSYIARQSGVDSDTMTSSLERLSKSAYAAATAAPGTVNAYTRLGVAVKDSNGAMLPASDIMAALADKFAQMGPSTERTALAMQIFGRGGAAILPVLAEGSDGIKKMSDEADRFGVTVSGQTAQAAHTFEQSLDQIKEAGIGVGNQLMIQLLPAMQTVASQFVDALKDPDSALNSMITVVAFLGKVIISVGEIIVTAFSNVKTVVWGVLSFIQEATTGLGNVIWDVLHGRFDLIVDDAKNAGKNIANAFKATASDIGTDWSSLGNKLGKVWSDAGTPQGPIKQKRSEEQPIAGGTAGVAAKAEKDIVTELVDKLQEQAAAEAKISHIVADSAYSYAVQKAAVDAEAKIEDTRNKLMERQVQLKQELESAKGTKKEAGISSQLADTNKQLSELAAAAPKIKSLYESMAVDKQITAADEALRKQTVAINAEVDAYNRVAAAAFGTAQQQREAAASEAAAKYAEENPELATQERLAVVYDNALKQQDLAYQKTILQSAVQDDLNKKYEDEITKLQAVRDVLIANGKDTLLADAQLYDAQRKINSEWDDAAIKVGNFREVTAGTLDKLSQQAENFGATMSKSIITAVNSSTDALSKFLVTGSKTNFKQIGQNFAESITGGLLKTGVSNIAGGLLGKLGLSGLLPGAGAPDGTKNNPWYVSIADAGALSSLPGFGSASSGIGSLFSGGLFSQPPASPAGSGQPGGSGFSLGGLFKSIFSFIPGLASGGDVMPGGAYIVGEDRPELFVPDRPGKIVPDMSKMKSTGGNLNAQVVMHVHGASNPDTFRKATPQIMQDMYRNMTQAHQHNGGY